jgi:hypothetical protein
MQILTIIIVSTGIFFGNNNTVQIHQGYYIQIEINREAILENNNETIVISEQVSSLFVDKDNPKEITERCKCDKERTPT